MLTKEHTEKRNPDSLTQEYVKEWFF